MVEEPGMEIKRDPETNMVFPFPLFPSECDETHPCEGLGRHATFRNFGMAFLTLFRVSTGDNWNGIMKVRTWARLARAAGITADIQPPI